jgi:hypothetical protein
LCAAALPFHHLPCAVAHSVLIDRIDKQIEVEERSAPVSCAPDAHLLPSAPRPHPLRLRR